jgi:glycerophosphoryl diester phosphodiesterase
VVSTLTLARLKELDYASWHPDHADDLVRRAPDESERGVLTLESLLDLVADAPRVRLFVETKHPVRYGGLVETKLVAMLRSYGMARPRSKEDSQIVMMSFSSRAVRRVREHSETLPTVLLLEQLSVARWDGALPSYADYTGPGVHILRADPDYVDRARAAGHGTYVWTVDEPEDVALCAKLGVRFLATNSPATTRAVLNR